MVRQGRGCLLVVSLAWLAFACACGGSRHSTNPTAGPQPTPGSIPLGSRVVPPHSSVTFCCNGPVRASGAHGGIVGEPCLAELTVRNDSDVPGTATLGTGSGGCGYALDISLEGDSAITVTPLPGSASCSIDATHHNTAHCGALIGFEPCVAFAAAVPTAIPAKLASPASGC